MSLLGEEGFRAVEEKPDFGYACVRRLSTRSDRAPGYCSGRQTAD